MNLMQNAKCAVIHSQRKKDTSSVLTQLVYSFIGFGYMFRIESVHHQAVTYTGNSRYNVMTSTYSTFIVFFCVLNDDTPFVY
jgi:hypothetical protein